jgi:predicted  nucleic acid-binding Zn-ribbon protein
MPLAELKVKEKQKVEKEVRSILKVEDEETPVILDLESVRVLGPGKFELDLVSLLNRRPIVFKLEEGKYLIDLDSGLGK